MRKILSFLFILPALAATAQGAEGTAKGFWSDPFNDPMFPVYVIGALVVVTILLILVVAIYMLSILNMFVRKAAEEKAAKLGIVYKPEPSMFKKFWDSMNYSVPLEEEGKIELDHNYDGIKELDNHLPPWWKYLFYATIIWGIGYMIVYHVSNTLPLSGDEYQNEVAEASEQKRKFLASQPKVQIDENSLTYSDDAEIIGKGKSLYVINCAPCHKDDGGGSVGPNLTDAYWLHGGDIKSIYATVKNGVPEKGMVSWATVLSPEQIRDVSFFVMSLKGTNPVNARAPQGVIIDVEQPVKTDSTKVQASL